MAKDQHRSERPYNRKVVVYQQNASTAADTDGAFTETASAYCTRWVRAWPLIGREQAAMEHQQPTVDWIVQVRSDEITRVITSAMWIVLPTGERLNITSVYDPDGRNRDVEIRARQVAS